MTKKHELVYPEALGQGEVAMTQVQAFAAGQRNKGSKHGEAAFESEF